VRIHTDGYTRSPYAMPLRTACTCSSLRELTALAAAQGPPPRHTAGDWLLLQTDKGCPEVSDDSLFKTVAEVQSVHDCQWQATHVDPECASYGGAMLLKSIDSPQGCRCMRRTPDNVTLVPCHLDPTMRGWDVFLFIGARAALKRRNRIGPSLG